MILVHLFVRVNKTFGVPFAAVALPSCLLILLVVFLMEWFIPWQDDLPVQVSGHLG